MNNKSSFILAVTFAALMASCGQQNVSTEAAGTGAPVENENKPNEEQLKKFLYDTEGTYGWETTADDISFDFLQDGRLHIQGADGEATMWEGTWTLKGDQLTLDRKDLGKTEIVTAKQDGDKLILGDKTYTRYSPVQ